MKQQIQKNPWQRSFAEKVSFTISLFILSLIVSLICYTWIAGETNPPTLSITTGSEIREINQQYYVPFTVTNEGGSTAESVEVVGQLQSSNGELEMAHQQIDFLSRKEQHEGEFIFSFDPQQGKLKVRIASYKLP
jgi:uncharacterized protein (TIGR02588 family)